MSAQRRLGVFALALSACGFGESIVGYKGAQHGEVMPCTAMAAGCDSVINFAPLQAPATPMIDTAACGNRGSACADGQSLTECTGSVVLSADNPESRTIGCAEVDFSIPAGVSQITLNMSAAHSALSFTAQSPVVVELLVPALDTVQVTLRGPITLQVHQPLQLNGVLIRDASGEGQNGASVELKDGTATNVSVVGVRGHVSVERCTLNTVDLFAASVDLETITATDLDISAPELLIAEFKGNTVNIETQHAIVSAATFGALQLQQCDSALFTNTVANGSRFGPCSTVLRYDHGAINDSLLGGPIESLMTIFDTDTFGPGVPTSLLSWQDSISNNRFCAAVSKVTLGDVAANLVCNDCTETTPNPPQLFCGVPGSYTLDGIVPTPGLDDKNPGCPVMTAAEDCNPAPINFNPK